MVNMIVTKLISNFKIFELENESFSKREALRFLIENADRGILSCSIRQLAWEWKWHKSKVERFLSLLKRNSIISTTVAKGKLQIEIFEYQKLLQDNFEDSLQDSKKPSHQAFQEITEADLETTTRTTESYRPNEDNEIGLSRDIIEDNDRDTRIQSQQPLPSSTKTNLETNLETAFHSQEEEKKKRSKKRKEEEFIKERNIPYGDTKKEKIAFDSFQNFDLDNSTSHFPDPFKASKIPVHLVETKDVAEWAEANLQIDLDLTWELGKFQDYWLTARKKPPKDGVAAFRNWLRKASEIKINNQGDRYDRFNNKKQKTSDFQRFLIGGAGALDELRRDRLDRNPAWEK